jgi:hypothetical protein
MLSLKTSQSAGQMSQHGYVGNRFPTTVRKTP